MQSFPFASSYLNIYDVSLWVIDIEVQGRNAVGDSHSHIVGCNLRQLVTLDGILRQRGASCQYDDGQKEK
jgi:hypothetical protein